jgi:hypothetical protein
MTELERAKIIHEKAMALSQEATMARIWNDETKAQILYKESFDLEREAAYIYSERFDKEPIRSILYRSAASLAVECLMYQEADLLIQQGLSSTTPLDVINDFRELKEKIDQELLESLDLVKQQRRMKDKNDTITFIGYLQSANVRTNKIRLVNGSENKDITVNFGLAEMVRTFFDNKVRALVRKTRGNQYELINLVKEE